MGERSATWSHDDGLERREVKLGEGTQDFLEISEGLHEGEQVVLKPVLSEVEQDTNEETPLVSEADLNRADCRRDRISPVAGTAGHRVALIDPIATVASRQPLALRSLE